MNANFIYPPMPENADESVIKPSESFKKSVVSVTFAMLLFVTVYLFILACAIAIAFAGAFAGVTIIAGYPSFLTLALGIGFILSGILLLYFLIKFIEIGV